MRFVQLEDQNITLQADLQVEENPDVQQGAIRLGRVDEHQLGQSLRALGADVVHQVKGLLAVQHEVDQLETSKIPQVPHEPLERVQELATGPKEANPLGVFPVGHVAGEGELEPSDVSAHDGHVPVVGALSFGVPGHHVHELVEVVEVEHGLEDEGADVATDSVDAGGGSHVVQDVLPAAVVVELAPGQGRVLQGEDGPDLLAVEGVVPGPAGEGRVVALPDFQVREDLLQEDVRELVPVAVASGAIFREGVFVDVDVQGWSDFSEIFAFLGSSGLK